MPSSLPTDPAGTKAVDTFGIGTYDSLRDGDSCHGEDDEQREPPGASLPDGGPSEGFDVDFWLSYPQETALGPKHASDVVSRLVSALASGALPGDSDRPPPSPRPADSTLDALAGPPSDVRTTKDKKTGDTGLPSDSDNPSARSDYYDRMTMGLDEGRFWPSEDSGSYVTQEKKGQDGPAVVEESDEAVAPYKVDGHYVDEHGGLESYPEPEFNEQSMDDGLKGLGNAWSGYVVEDQAVPHGHPSENFMEESDFLDENPILPEVWNLQPFGYASSNMRRTATDVELVRGLTKDFLKEHGRKNIVRRHVLAFLQSRGLPQYLASDVVRCMKHDHDIVIPDVMDTFPVAQEPAVDVRRLAGVRQRLFEAELENVRRPEVASAIRRCAALVSHAIAGVERLEIPNG